MHEELNSDLLQSAISKTRVLPDLLLPTTHLGPALQTAMLAGGMGLWEWHPDTDIAYWNPQLYDLARLPRGSGVEPGSRFAAMVVAEDQPALQELLTELSGRGEYRPRRFRIRAGDGSIRWIVSCGQSVANHRGSAARAVVGVNLDVTDQVEAADRVAAAEARERQQTDIVRSVMAHVPLGIAVAGVEDGELLQVSQFGLDMIERNAADGHRWDAWQVYHLDGKTPARKEEMALYRAARGEVIRSEEWLIRCSDGQLLPVCCSAGPVLNDQGDVAGGVVAWYDVTSFKQAQAERTAALIAEQQARQAAEEANRQKDVFLGMVSHELRTPLSAILGWTKILDSTCDPAKTQRGMAAIERNARLLARLVDDLLDVTRLTVGRLELLSAPADLQAIAQAALDLVQPAALARGVVLQWTAAISTVPILGDAQRLQQAIGNLLFNAIKFSADGGLVLLELMSDEKEAILQITDHGVGIAPEALPHLFERFWQAENGAKGGLGLGLAITKHIVDRHGGDIEVASDGVGHGTTFRLKLPLAHGLLKHSF